MGVDRSIDLNLLVALDALLEERNVTRAAERIVMTQPAMSGLLGRLRRHFDDELLVRVGRGYELTPRAAALAPLVRDALRAVERTLEVSADFDPATSTREFSITATDYASIVLVEPLSRVLRERAPGTTVVFDPPPPEHRELPSYLERRDLIIGGAGLGIPGRRQTVFVDVFVCICDAASDLAGLRHADLGEVLRRGYVVSDFGPGTQTPADRALASRGVEARAVTRVHGLAGLPFAVAGTDLVAFVPHRLARLSAKTLGIAIVDVDWDAPRLVEAAHWHPARDADPALRWLRGVLREVGGAL